MMPRNPIGNINVDMHNPERFEFNKLLRKIKPSMLGVDQSMLTPLWFPAAEMRTRKLTLEVENHGGPCQEAGDMIILRIRRMVRELAEECKSEVVEI